MTLPSPWYLQHLPQYIPPSPGFPLERELAGLEAASGAQSGIAGFGGSPSIGPAPATGALPLPPAPQFPP
jgi:hypothetical protein